MGNANVASNWISEVRWDEQGRPYRVLLMPANGKPAGTRTYLAPIEALQFDDPKIRQWGQQNQRPGQSLLKDAGTWNPTTGKWDQGANWTNLANMGVGAFLAAPALAGAAGGGGAAPASGAGGTLPASSIPVSQSMYGPAAIASQGASAGIPLGGVTAAGAAGGAAAGAAAGGGGSLASRLTGALTSPAGIGALAGLAGLAATGGFGNNTPQMDPNMARILAMNEAQMRRADPLHQAAVQLSFGNLPTYARTGIDLPKVPLP